MAEFPALPLWTDAYLADCSHLSDAEHGCYMLVLMAMWRAPMQRLPNDAAWFSRKFGRSQQVIENEWFPLMRELCQCSGNWWTQKRLRREYAYVSKQREAQSARAKHRWEKEKDVCRRNATTGNAASGSAPTPTPTPLKKDTLSAVPADFARFWADYPTEKNMSKKRALAAWKKLTPEKRAAAQAAISGYRSYCEKNKSWYHTVHAERFLSQERFEGYAVEQTMTDEEIAAAKDRTDRILKRGKYDPQKIWEETHRS